MKLNLSNSGLICLLFVFLGSIALPAAFSSAPNKVSQQPASPATLNYDTAMRAGYAAVQNRDYQTALRSFRQALELRSGDTFAQQAIQNVEGYLERQAQTVDSAYDRAMRIGYAASQKRDYQTALINFRRALKEKPGNRYALQAIRNVEAFISRERSPAPWAGPPLSQSQVPAVLLTEWKQAENRTTCAALAPKSLGQYADAKPRAAYFSGGWAIAYDQPGLPGRNPDGTFCPNCGRGVFGIAGAGVEVVEQNLQQWPYQKVWADGSQAGYGPASGEASSYLAFVQVQGQRCLYNVWSFLGKDHLESLLEQLRLVEGAA